MTQRQVQSEETKALSCTILLSGLIIFTLEREWGTQAVGGRESGRQSNLMHVQDLNQMFEFSIQSPVELKVNVLVHAPANLHADPKSNPTEKSTGCSLCMVFAIQCHHPWYHFDVVLPTVRLLLASISLSSLFLIARTCFHHFSLIRLSSLISSHVQSC